MSNYRLKKASSILLSNVIILNSFIVCSASSFSTNDTLNLSSNLYSSCYEDSEDTECIPKASTLKTNAVSFIDKNYYDDIEFTSGLITYDANRTLSKQVTKLNRELQKSNQKIREFMSLYNELTKAKNYNADRYFYLLEYIHESSTQLKNSVNDIGLTLSNITKLVEKKDNNVTGSLAAQQKIIVKLESEIQQLSKYYAHENCKQQKLATQLDSDLHQFSQYYISQNYDLLSKLKDIKETQNKQYNRSKLDKCLKYGYQVISLCLVTTSIIFLGIKSASNK